ncbi:MAG: acyl-ACP--UDP-N-acetylglucosamine O-acyltransferase [Prochlorococcus sp.]|jgi:UDP-N-acetylglucosamine acyltransferase|nr:acyl-ACP--UDP-N-acetylglucosamine O-acyltransferase [Prochlorococcaceae cyanobacterium ETNP18_MAG_14]HJL68918.1 acyl-ACP--UDP-N-acetylglucosamine O-acyltransferase [Prochlorococcaceae cyanobacterium Gl_MAG_24]|tara:strand:- start:1843 stop:2694 length:852 start_codon:yes stop_codon:yes gene_type:complete
MSEPRNLSVMNAEGKVQLHPSAVVDPRAELDSGVIVGPGAIIGPDVKIGAQSWIGPHVVLDGRLTLGSNNRVFPGACLGLEPQDLKYRGAPTEVVIGDDNTIREYVTINRATEEGEQTRIGNENLLMAYCHLGHNCELGNGIVMSNGIQVAGHVVIEDRAVIGGCLGIHQFVHIGRLAMVGGMTRVDRDVPPYCLVEGQPGRVRGLNRVGLRRSGLNTQQAGELGQLQEIWNLLFRSDHVIVEALRLAREEQLMPAAEHLCAFLEASIQKGRRGPMSALNSTR